MKKLFLMAALLLGFGSASFAQDVNWGVRAGVGFGHALGSVKSDDYNIGDSDFGTKVGFSIGAVADIKLSESFYLQPGLYYVNKGYKNKYEEKDNGSSYKATVKYGLHYFEIPVLASYRHSINNDIVLQGNFGPYIAVGLGGKVKNSLDIEGNLGAVNIESSSNTSYPAFGVSDKVDEERGDLQRFDFGLSFGVGLTLKEHYYAGIKYDLGLVNMFNTKDEHSIYYYKYYKNEKAPRSLQGNFSICFGYNF